MICVESTPRCRGEGRGFTSYAQACNRRNAWRRGPDIAWLSSVRKIHSWIDACLENLSRVVFRDVSPLCLQCADGSCKLPNDIRGRTRKVSIPVLFSASFHCENDFDLLLDRLYVL